MPLGPRIVPLPARMQVPGSTEEEMELGMAEPLAVTVLASAAGAMDIEDTELPAQHHYCLSLPEEEWPEAPLPSADEQIPTPDSPGPAPWPRRVRAALWRYRSMAMLAMTVLALMAGGSYACVRYRAQLLQAGDYIRRHAPLSAVYYSLIVALWIVLCLPSTIIELGTWCASHSYAHTPMLMRFPLFPTPQNSGRPALQLPRGHRLPNRGEAAGLRHRLFDCALGHLPRAPVSLLHTPPPPPPPPHGRPGEQQPPLQRQ
jgi:hypothetical protein